MTTATKTPTRKGRPITTTVGALRAARRIIEENGITKGCMLNSRGRTCSAGAVALALGGDEEMLLAEGWAYRSVFKSEDQHALFQGAIGTLSAVVQCQSSTVGGIAGFNDRPATRKRDVLGVFDLAIADAASADRKARRLAAQASA